MTSNDGSEATLCLLLPIKQLLACNSIKFLTCDSPDAGLNRLGSPRLLVYHQARLLWRDIFIPCIGSF